MARYSIFIKPSAVKELESLPLKDWRRVAKRIQALADAPRPPGSEKLSGEDKYRVRQGDYRILYTLVDVELALTIIKIGHRRDVYR